MLLLPASLSLAFNSQASLEGAAIRRGRVRGRRYPVYFRVVVRNGGVRLELYPDIRRVRKAFRSEINPTVSLQLAENDAHGLAIALLAMVGPVDQRRWAAGVIETWQVAEALGL